MKQILIIVGASVGGLIMLAVLVTLFSSHGSTQTVDTNSLISQTGIVEVKQNYGPNYQPLYVANASSTLSSTKMELELADGSGLVVQDFEHDVQTITDPSLPYQYFLTGGLDPVKYDFPYSISFSSLTQTFTITLLQDPLGAVRADAEAELMSRLGIDASTTCKLKYHVVVPSWQSVKYTGRDLGFGFCPGSVALGQ